MNNIWDASEKSELLDRIEAYKTSGDASVASTILEKYHAQVKTELEYRQQANLKLLEDYSYCYMDGVELPDVFPVWMDEQEVIYFLPSEKRFAQLQRLNFDREELKRNTSIAVLSQFWENDLSDYERRTSLLPESRFMDMDIPMYLLYTPEEWAVFLQVTDIAPLLSLKRIVFLVGDGNTKACFNENGVIFPSSVHGTNCVSEYISFFQELSQGRLKKIEEDFREIQLYYSENEAAINRHFAEGKPKILAITTRFSTAIQFHNRDSMAAVQHLGGETMILIEKDPLHRVDIFGEARAVAEFKPDAVFLIDHFRWEHDLRLFPKEMISIIWAQDPMPHVMNSLTPKKLSVRDFIMNHFITWENFFDVGYDRGQIIEAPIPADSRIYKPYELTEEERERYEADVCLVCHAADVDGKIQEMSNRFDASSRPMIAALYREYQRLAYEKVIIYYSEEEFKEYIDKFFKREYRTCIPVNIRDMLANHMKMWFNQAVFRQIIVDWLIDAKITNIKLWGNGWTKYEKYKKYAMGPAQNGETLSKIYQASKIVLGNNCLTTSAARAWESMLSGAFYMSNYIPSEADWTDIRKIMKSGEDLVIFYNRKDLIKKVRYYLKHDDERREMARRGREVALQKMTYDALMKRVIQFIGDKVSAASKEAE